MIIQILINFLVILSFVMYIFLGTDKTDWYSRRGDNLTFMDSIYFCMTSFSSVGYGDIVPASTKSKVIVIILQMFIIFEILSISQHVGGCLSMGFLYNILITFAVLIIGTLYFTFGTEKTDWVFPSALDTNSFLNMFYFTNTTLTTCGYGEIVPNTNKTKIPVMIIQTLIILQILSIFT